LLYYSQWNGTTLDPTVFSGEENDFVSLSLWAQFKRRVERRSICTYNRFFHATRK
jgi:hypothetical protein